MAKNQMITFEAEDLDSYWTELEALDLGKVFAGVKLKPLTQFPSGHPHYRTRSVCWHIRQSPADRDGFA